MISQSASPSVEHLQKELAALSVELQTKALSAGLVAAIKPIKADMAANAPKDKGNLAKSVGHKRLSKTAKARLGSVDGQSIDDDTLVLLVGPNRKVSGRSQAWKASLLEDGTKAHRIDPKNGKGLKLRGGGYANSVNHPGVRATGFMRKSLERNQAGLNDRFYTGLSRYLNRKRKASS